MRELYDLKLYWTCIAEEMTFYLHIMKTIQYTRLTLYWQYFLAYILHPFHMDASTLVNIFIRPLQQGWTPKPNYPTKQ